MQQSSKQIRDVTDNQAYSLRWSNDADLDNWNHLVSAWQRWVDQSNDWQAREPIAALWRRVAPRLQKLGETLERVLVVGFIGGTGTGKSTLINALLGERICPAGDLERPTTRQAIIIHHPNIDCSFLPEHDWQSKKIISENALLEHTVLIDCPDPDTQSQVNGNQDHANTEFHNLDLLRQIIPQCDVLLCLGTAQKYKTLAVLDELREHAPGRGVLFIQTHAEFDPDVRNDWSTILSQRGFETPTILRIDSEQALQAAEKRQSMPDEFVQLQNLLEVELHKRGHARLHRANAYQLLQWFADQSEAAIEQSWPAIEQLKNSLETQNVRLLTVAQRNITERLTSDRQTWRARLLSEVTARWCGLPFGMFMRLSESWWSWARWLPLLRMRGLSSLVLTGGAIAGQGIVSSLTAKSALVPTLAPEDLGWTAGELAQSQAIVAGNLANAKLAQGLTSDGIQDKQKQLADRAVEQTAALQQIKVELQSSLDRKISQRVRWLAHPAVQFVFEILFSSFVALLFYRWGHSYFYKHLWLGESPVGFDAILQGLMWIVVWGWVLRSILAAFLMIGWRRDVQNSVQIVSAMPAPLALFDSAQDQLKSCIATRDELQRLTGELKLLQNNSRPSQPTKLSRMQLA